MRGRMTRKLARGMVRSSRWLWIVVLLLVIGQQIPAYSASPSATGASADSPPLAATRSAAPVDGGPALHVPASNVSAPLPRSFTVPGLSGGPSSSAPWAAHPATPGLPAAVSPVPGYSPRAGAGVAPGALSAAALSGRQALPAAGATATEQPTASPVVSTRASVVAASPAPTYTPPPGVRTLRPRGTVHPLGLGGGETITVPFTNGTTGVNSVNSYSGSTTITVSGTGQASGCGHSDAFYIYADCNNQPYNPPIHYAPPLFTYTWMLWINGGPSDNFVSPVQAYRADHIYTVTITAPGGVLNFAVGDTNTGDNTGAYTVMINGGSGATSAAATGCSHGGGCAESHKTDCSTVRPVNCATGEFWHTFSDLSVPGRGLPLSLTRTYNSLLAGQDGPFGFGWSESYTMSATTDASGAVTIVEANGSSLTFAKSGTTYQAPGNVMATLVDNGDGTLTLARKDRSQYVFTAPTVGTAGPLLKEIDRNGYLTGLAYSGGCVKFQRTAAGCLFRVVPSGQ